MKKNLCKQTTNILTNITSMTNKMFRKHKGDVIIIYIVTGIIVVVIVVTVVIVVVIIVVVLGVPRRDRIRQQMKNMKSNMP